MLLMLAAGAEQILGKAVQVGPMKPTLKPPPETKRLKLQYDVPLSNLLSNTTCTPTPWIRRAGATLGPEWKPQGTMGDAGAGAYTRPPLSST